MSDKELEQYFRQTCFSERNAAPAARLEAALHMSGSDLRRRVNRLRRNGIPIASGKSGYFYAQTAHEVYRTILQLRQMERGLQQAVEGLEGAMRGFGERGEHGPGGN